MTGWTNRAGRSVLMGLAWAAAWVPVGALTGWFIVGELEPEWIGGPLYAGFVCGAIFPTVAGIADGRRTLDAMPLSRAAVRGMASGLLAGGLWLAVALLSDPPKWVFESSVVGTLGVLGAMSGVGSALVATVGRKRRSRAR